MTYRQPDKDTPLDHYVRDYVRAMERGEKVLFLFRAYRDNQAEFVHFRLLLQESIYSAMVFENPGEHIQTEFPPPCVVWIHIDKKVNQYRITEATCLDERSKEENKLAIEKVTEFQSMLDLPFTQGETRMKWIPPTSKQSKLD